MPPEATAHATPPDNQHTLRRLATSALKRIHLTSGAELAFCGTVDGNSLTLSDFEGPVVGPLRGTKLQRGHGAGGKIMEQRRPLAMHDYVRDSSIVHTHDRIIRAEGIGALVAAPVVVGTRHVAVLYAASRSTQTELGRMLDSVVNEARLLEQSLAVSEVIRKPLNSPILGDSVNTYMVKAYADLRAIAGDIEDSSLRARIHRAADLLTSTIDEPWTAVRPTRREHDVLALLSLGMSNADIATKLGIGIHTVKDHVKNLRIKYGASNRFDVVFRARHAGVVP